MNKKKAEAKNNKTLNTTYLDVLFRWFALAIITADFILGKEKTKDTTTFTICMIAAVIYAIIVTRLKLNRNYKRNSNVYFYTDTIMLSVFVVLLGGLNSDMYLIYFFVIGYSGVSGNNLSTVKISIFSIFLFSISSLVFKSSYIGGLSYWKLVLRDIFLLCAALGIDFIHVEIKKYDEMHKREFKLARTDKLTGLANRHYFDQKLQEEALYSDATGLPINILIFDLDNFKKFNDSYGHVWGDKLLTLFSDIIKQNIRKADIPVRFGGEEFLILLRDLDLETARSVGERIRKHLEKQRIYVGTDNNRQRVTVSCGVAQYPRHSGSIRAVVECADKALYHAKEIGKNTVVGYEDIC
ncbi:MAG: GGDEF domain-containing protein [Bacillota bacterium]|nr:GGDEF domain-containing protein [Bacillota bacterium]